MPDITSLFVTRLYRAKLNELAKKKVDYDELRVTCETVAEDDEAGQESIKRAVLKADPLPYAGFEEVFSRNLTINFRAQDR